MKKKKLSDSSIGHGMGAIIGDNYDKTEEDLFDDGEEYDQLPMSLRGAHKVASYRVFSNVRDVLNAFSRGQITLRRAEGTKFAYVESVVFVDGAAYPFPNSASSFLGPLLCDDRVVTLDLISRICPSDFDITVVNSNAAKFVHAFIEAGYFYPVYK